MDTQIDWQRELDASFGTGHDVPADHYVSLGRTTVRRRRRILAAAGLATAAVVASAVWVVAPHGLADSEAPVATEPSRTSVFGRWEDQDLPVRVGRGGELEIRPGAVVHARRDNLFPDAGTDAVALDISFDGMRQWLIIEWAEVGRSETISDRWGSQDFDDFVDEAVREGSLLRAAAKDRAPSIDDLVVWEGTEVSAKEGVELLRVVDDPVPSVNSVAMVLRRRDVTWWLLVFGSGAKYSRLSVAQPGQDFEAWLAGELPFAAANAER